MRARFWGWLAPVVLALAVLLAPPWAWADSYTDQLASQFGPTQHVVADPAAKPPLQRAEELNQQILGTNEPIYVAAVAADQTGITTPDALHSALRQRLGKFEGVILVIDANGYHVRSYNVPAAIANGVDPLLHQSAAEHRNDPYGATSAFVTKLSAVHVPTAGAPAGTTQSRDKSGSLTWLWVLLGIVGGIGAIVLLVGFFSARARKQRERQALREQVEQDLISVEPDVNDLAEAVVSSSDVDVSAESNKAGLSFSSAQSAFKNGNFSAAAAHINNVRAAVRAANFKLHPLDVEAVQSVPQTERKQGSVGVNDPTTGQPVVINNNDYRTSPSAGYGNYYGGGMYNGMYFYPGWYSYPFYNWYWSPLDVIIADELLFDHWNGNYGYGYAAPQTGQADVGFDATSTDQSNQDWNRDDNWSGGSWDSQQANVGFDGGGWGSGSGGGYDSGSSSVDFGGGGGWDSGGGSFDSGSSGGGDSGF